jgi:hypothetical protein
LARPSELLRNLVHGLIRNLVGILKRSLHATQDEQPGGDEDDGQGHADPASEAEPIV